MFDVESSAKNRISVRNDSGDQRWCFVVEERGGGRTLTLHSMANLSDAEGSADHAARALRFAELEAWKRGIID